ncbi:MAG: ATP--guanido phosphotransferase [Gemmatimonadota bacterium]|nr:ATP--guanido phosphotransferase [Gemmatimonadota bacterium]
MSAGGPGVGDRGLRWLTGSDEDGGVVLSTRVRLARNLQGFPFGGRADPEDAERILERARAVAGECASLAGSTLWEIADLDANDRAILLERHLVSRELLGPESEPPPAAALALAAGDDVGLMVNEEDHFRLQAFGAGFALEETWRRLDLLDEEIGTLLPYAFHPEFGYLTSCPTNVGTGLRASVLVHLPGLVLTREIHRVLEGISQVGLTFRGLHGEGSEIAGNLFQISNQTTLGKTESELIDHLARVAGKVVEYERNARTVLLREAPAVIEDKVWRAYGILRHARAISGEELLNLLSGLRLGVALKLLPTPRVETLNEILVLARTAHRIRDAGTRLDDTEVDVARAAFVRARLERDESGDARPGTDPRSTS